MKTRYPDTAEGWLAYLLRADVSEENSAALATWCEARPENRTEFELLSRGWHLAGELDAGELESDLDLAEFPAAEPGSPWPYRFLAAAGLACVLVAAQWLMRGLDQVSRYQTARGEQRTVALDDGSRIVLNTATTLDFDASRQRVNLLAGEALFDVSPRQERSFSVDAGATTIQVLGTRFNVLREGENLLVSVLEGRVRVDTRAGPGVKDTSREISAGQALEIHPSEKGPRIRHGGSDLDRVKAWREGKIELDQTPLREALRELSRYTPVPLKISEPHLEELRLTGIFRIDRLGDLSSVRFALENSLPVRLRSTDDAVELVHRP